MPSCLEISSICIVKSHTNHIWHVCFKIRIISSWGAKAQIKATHAYQVPVVILIERNNIDIFAFLNKALQYAAICRSRAVRNQPQYYSLICCENN
jgi:hypothetical protein